MLEAFDEISLEDSKLTFITGIASNFSFLAKIVGTYVTLPGCHHVPFPVGPTGIQTNDVDNASRRVPPMSTNSTDATTGFRTNGQTTFTRRIYRSL